VLAIILGLRLQTLEQRIRELQINTRQGFPTDLADAKPYIDYEERVFTGLIKMNETSGSLYHHVPLGKPRYFGDPEIYPEIDENWKDLLRSMLISSVSIFRALIRHEKTNSSA
jgi:hypothetical protein